MIKNTLAESEGYFMKKYRFMAGLMCFVLSSTVFIGCGKEKIPEAATINNETTDIYATKVECTNWTGTSEDPYVVK